MKKMKWMVLGLAIIAMAPAAMGAALITQGSNELGLSGFLDFQSGLGTDVNIEVRYAYFVIDRASLGGKFCLRNNEFFRYFTIGVSGEYNFKLPNEYRPLFGTDLVPFVGAAVDYRYSNVKYMDDESAVVFGAEGGVKFFLTDTTAITVSLRGEIATEDVFVDDDEITNRDLQLLLGMRFYF
ncbi:MAG: porin family protein [Lentisphaerae bacterium]|jgi:hypothetical protein|nr:porin family protein [Lentisphaerota bacterium]